MCAKDSHKEQKRTWIRLVLHPSQYLLTLSCATLYPGHGALVTEGSTKITEYINHRNAREKQIYEALSNCPDKQATPTQLTKIVYKVNTFSWRTLPVMSYRLLFQIFCFSRYIGVLQYTCVIHHSNMFLMQILNDPCLLCLSFRPHE